MNRTKRVAAIGLLCIGTSALSFGDVFGSIDSPDWDATYTSSTALFGAVVGDGGASLASGFFPGTNIQTGTSAFVSDETFTLTYAPGSGITTFQLGSGPEVDLSLTVPTLAPAGGGLDHIGISLSTGSSDEAITISNLVLDGGTPDAGVLSSPLLGGVADFQMTPPTDLTGLSLVTLTGNINITGAGSDISATIIGADASFITPEPSTWALFGSALVGLGLLRRKRIV